MNTSGDAWKLGNRPALTGIRGIAIVLVVFCHTELPHLFGGGPVGVTVFFTLSGFLITSLLLESGQAASAKVDLGRFYVRRFRRLAPAAVVNIAVTAVAALWMGDWWLEWGDVPPAMFYYANWVLALTPNDLGALGGFWSLSIEEQFYLVWPLILLLAARRGVRVVMAVAAIGTIASLLCRPLLWASHAEFERVYYGTDAVASALLIGAFGAAWVRTGTMPNPPRGSLSVGLAAISVAAVTTGGLLWYAAPVLAAAGTALVIWATSAGPDEDGGPAWLRSRPLVYLGERSYSLYLWHIGPAYALRTHTDLPWPALLVIVSVLGVGLAEFSYRWVEQPFRARSPHTPGPSATQGDAVKFLNRAAVAMNARTPTRSPER